MQFQGECNFIITLFLVHRELQEGKTTGTESQPAPADVMAELPAGLLGLEIPPEVRNVLKVSHTLQHLSCLSLTPKGP